MYLKIIFDSGDERLVELSTGHTIRVADSQERVTDAFSLDGVAALEWFSGEPSDASVADDATEASEVPEPPADPPGRRWWQR